MIATLKGGSLYFGVCDFAAYPPPPVYAISVYAPRTIGIQNSPLCIYRLSLRGMLVTEPSGPDNTDTVELTTVPSVTWWQSGKSQA